MESNHDENLHGVEFCVLKIKKYFKNQKIPNDLTKPFVDELFPPNRNSLLALDKNNQPLDVEQYNRDLSEIDISNIEWKRAPEIFPEFLLFEGKIEFNDVKQGNLGNCYFLSALAALTEFPNLIFKIFKSKEVSHIGLYEIALFIDGEWQIVIVDDYLPFNTVNSSCAFAKPNGNELWVLILEKAWAKINGGYLNIIGGFASEPLGVMTGFSKRRFDTDEIPLEELWKIIRDADTNDNIMCCATRSNKANEEKGLVSLHAYTLISAKSTKIAGKEIRLCQIRNPHGSKEWNGDWSDKSSLWNEKLDKIFDHHVNSEKDLNDGLFFISIEDFVKYFKSIYICFTIYRSEVKNYEIGNKTKLSLEKAQVFSLFIPNDCEASVTAHAPFWRFNRNLKNKSHPITVLIAKVDPNANKVEFFDGDFCADDDPSVKKKLIKGYYLIWVYCGVDENKQRLINGFQIKICANSRFMSNYETEDTKFKVFRQIMLSGIRQLHKKEIADDTKFGVLKNSFKSTGIAYYVKFNNTPSTHIKFSVDSSQIEGFAMLPPSDVLNKYEIFGQPSSEVSLFAMRTSQYGKYWFNIDINTWISSAPFAEDKSAGKNFYSKNQKMEKYLSLEKLNVVPRDSFYSYISPSCEEAKLILEFESLNINELNKDQLLKEYPEYMEKVFKIQDSPKFKDLEWKKIQFANGLYLGQINEENARHGRGSYIFADASHIVGVFISNERNGYFEEFSSSGNLIFKGTYLKGKKNGKGVYYFDNGSYYDGEYKNDIRHGKGGYYFPSGQKYVGDWADNQKQGKGIYFYSENEYWEGTFANNEFHGTGIYRFSSGITQKMTFINGQKIEK